MHGLNGLPHGETGSRPVLDATDGGLAEPAVSGDLAHIGSDLFLAFAGVEDLLNELAGVHGTQGR